MVMKPFPMLISLKNQLLLYFVLLALILGVIFGVYYYITFAEIVNENVGNSQYKVVSELMDNIDVRMNQISDNINWMSVNQNLISVLNRPPEDVEVFDKTKELAISDIEGRFKFSPISGYISAFYIIGNNGLDVREGDNAYLAEPELFKDSSWYRKGVQMDGGQLWGHAIKNYARVNSFKKYEYIVPFFKKIIDIEEWRVIGNIVVFFDPQVFVSMINEEHENANEEVYLVNQEGIIIMSTDIEMCGESINEKEYSNRLSSGSEKYFISNIENEQKLVVYNKSEYSNWYLIKELSLDLMTEQNTRIGNTVIVIVLVTIAFVTILSVFLTGNFVKPIKKLVRQVNEIAKGNFDQCFKNDKIHLIELKELSRDLENMSHDIRDLIQRNLLKEEEKKQLELEMLQSQINPHFLYNTLNLVSWMAQIQRSFGIKQTIDSLMKLLDFSTKNIDKEIPIEDELDALEHYMNIQRIRYKGKVTFSIECMENEILSCTIPKFILQPIIENSVFHGIEPKNGTGKISIKLFRQEENIFIEICDDGVGITKDKIKRILEGKGGHKEGSRSKGVGLANVNRRIKLICGTEYGIDIESAEEEYTKVIVKLPVQGTNYSREVEQS